MGAFNTACFLTGSVVVLISVMGGIEMDSGTTSPSGLDAQADDASGGSASMPNAPTGPNWDPANLPAGTGPTPWLDSAGNYIGTSEYGGNRGELIDQWNTTYGGKLGDPWCATFTNAMLAQNGLTGTGSPSSLSFANYGVDAGGPVSGSIVVFDWPGEGGHVGFVHSVNPNGTINVLGGNQSGQVKISTFATTYVVGYRLPEGYSGGGINTGTAGDSGGGFSETR